MTRIWRDTGLVLLAVAALITATAVLLPVRHHTTNRIPATCTTAATTTAAHLDSLTRGVGAQIQVSTIRRDITALTSCETP